MPYWRLSTFYLFYFASLGALLPYWSLYLQSLGFSPLQIGELMALLMATRIIAPNLWGWLADHTGRRMAVVRIGSMLAIIAFTTVFVARSYWAVAAMMFGFSFFWNAVLPQFEANTLTHLGALHHRYSRIRLWGSIGFIVSVVTLGTVFQHTGPQLLPVIQLGLFVSIWLASMVVPDSGVAQGHGNQGSIGETLRRPEVIALLVVCLLMQASHGPYYTFFTIYMEEHGYARSTIGWLWALGVAAEVGIFLIMHRLLPRLGARALLLASLAFAAVRWTLIGLFPDLFGVVLLAQVFHAASFGIYHAAAIALFHRHFAGRHHGKGQALYSSITYGLGGAIGAYFSGVLWETSGSTAAFLTAALLAVAGLVIGRRWIKA
jgi:PPP family 3-phenylpropionic acid transporter